jgi:uncharacterized protein YyaL (SSP411 family)
MTRNRLSEETSPYLLQHAANPVHWYGWSDEALGEAKRQDKPILLSIGYAACHWCHVMAHESFEDAATADLMNRLFINIKVDREERPDLDTIYQSALSLMGEHGGWPLTMFLTPQGEPFWGGTYFPPSSRYGRPAFRDVLKSLAEIYADSRDKVTSNVVALREALANLHAGEAARVAVDRELLDRVAARLAELIDPVHGGIRGAPKFPQATIFELLWRGFLRNGSDALESAVTNTLTQMCQGGIYDHLGGGFARYATDDKWLVPHFEKMLYDNAALIDLLTLVWQKNRDPLYAARIEETVGWALREMLAEGGAFAASFDADSEHVEGKFYVWSEAEIDALLGAESALFKTAYDVRPEGNWEDHTILNRTRRPLLGDDAHEARLAAARKILFAERAKRVPPGRDDKILADWNGLMIAALAEAGRCFARPDWIAAAETAFGFIAKAMRDGERLMHSFRLGRARHRAVLDDYAAMSRAALRLYEVTGRSDYLDKAVGWVAVADALHWDEKSGGYFLTASDASDLILRTKPSHDNAMPSGNGIMAEVLLRLAILTGERRYGERAEALLAAFSGEIAKNFFPLSTLLNAGELALRPVQIVILGARGAADTEAMVDAAFRISTPDRVLQSVADAASLPRTHPAHGKQAKDGRATAYLCIGQACSLPVTEPAALAELMAHDRR